MPRCIGSHSSYYVAGRYLVALLHRYFTQTAIYGDVLAVTHKHKGKIALAYYRCHPAVEHATCFCTTLTAECYASIVYLNISFTYNTLLRPEIAYYVERTCNGHRQLSLVLRKGAAHLFYAGIFGNNRLGRLGLAILAALFLTGSSFCNSLASGRFACFLCSYLTVYGTFYVGIEFLQLFATGKQFLFHLARLFFKLRQQRTLFLLQQLKGLALVCLLVEREFLCCQHAVELALFQLQCRYILFKFLALAFMGLHILAGVTVTACH